MISTLVFHQKIGRVLQTASSLINAGRKSQNGVSPVRTFLFRGLTCIVLFKEQQIDDFDSSNEPLEEFDRHKLGASPLVSPVINKASSNLVPPLRDNSPYPSPEDEQLSRTRTYPLNRAQPLWPLHRKDEAFLLQHFTTELAQWVRTPFNTTKPSTRQELKQQVRLL